MYTCAYSCVCTCGLATAVYDVHVLYIILHNKLRDSPPPPPPPNTCRHNMGYVTCNQFHQCLSYLGLSISPAHMRLVEMRFADQKGFNYLKFLDQLQPSEKLENKYQTRMTQLMSKQDQVIILLSRIMIDVHGVLYLLRMDLAKASYYVCMCSYN